MSDDVPDVLNGVLVPETARKTWKARSGISATMQPYALCMECNWKTDYDRDAKLRAREHVRIFGHRVQVVIEQITSYVAEEIAVKGTRK